jgi:predicted DNA-binding transcriptional regulator AlpA
MPVGLLSTDKVLALTGIPRSTFYFMRARGDFPKPVRQLAVSWRAEDVARWLAANPPTARIQRD